MDCGAASRRGAGPDGGDGAHKPAALTVRRYTVVEPHVETVNDGDQTVSRERGWLGELCTRVAHDDDRERGNFGSIRMPTNKSKEQQERVILEYLKEIAVHINI
jgi:hypothetical protein